MPPVILLALGALGTAIFAKFMARESRRVNDELEAARREAEMAGKPPESAERLERDPVSGHYRPRSREKAV